MKIKWHAHSCFEITGTRNTIIDPFLKDNPLAKTVEVNPDIIAVTHGHGDHLGDTVEIARKTHCKVVAIHEIARYLATCGVNCEGMNKGGTINIDGISFTMTEAIHSAGIDESDFAFDGGCPAGFIITDKDTKIYHAGDTALFGDMHMIGEMYQPQIALIPIGDRYTMGPREAALATHLINPKIAIPMHYGTYPIIDQSPEEYKEIAETLCESEIIILQPGETFEY